LIVLLILLRGLAHAPQTASLDAATPIGALASLKAAFVPFSLLIYHAPVPAGVDWPWIGLIALGVAAFAFRPALGAGVLWFALAVRFAEGRADRGGFDEAQLHLALAGVALLAAVLADWPKAGPIRVAAALTLVLVTLGCIALASTRNNQWRSEAALWIEAADACPECAVPPDRLGRLHFAQVTREVLGSTGTGAPLPDDVRGHFEYAEKLLGQAQSRGESSPESAVIRAGALRSLGRLADSNSVLNAALGRWPTDPELLLFRAESASMDAGAGAGVGGARRAVRTFRTADKRMTLPDMARISYAVALGRIGDWAAAAAALSGVRVDRDPGAAAFASEAAARARGAQGALAAYQQSADRLDASGRAVLMAAVLDAESHYQLSAQVARDAFRRSPSHVDLWMAVGAAESSLGRLEQFLRETPAPAGTDAAGALEAFAGGLVRRGDWAGVEFIYREGLGLSEFEATMRAASEAHNIGRETTAVSLYRRAAQFAPEDPAPWVAIADIALTAQQAELVREAIENAEQRGAPAQTLQTLKARAGMRVGDPGEPRRTIIR
jgi:tetratricopeptide (TPR) repeat protein